MKLHVLPLMIAVALTSACAQAASPPAAPVVAPAATPEATQAEIDRLVARIQELSKQLGGDTRIRIERHRFDEPGMSTRPIVNWIRSPG